MSDNYLIYGAMGLGGNFDKNSPVTTEHIEQAELALNAVIESGINFIDLADIYKAGKSEIVVGEYLKNNPGLREKLTIQSKVGIHLRETYFGSTFDFSYKHIVTSVDQILKRLSIDSLDILLLHRPDPLMDRVELKQAIDELFNSGRIKALGVSNMDYHQIKLIEAYTERKVVANQLELSLLKSDFVSNSVGFNNYYGHNCDFPIGTIEHCILNNIDIQSWSPVARGVFSRDEVNTEVDSKVLKTREIVNRIANERGVSANVIILAWLLKHPAKIKPVIGSTNPDRIKDSLKALNVDLTRNEWYELMAAVKGLPMP